MSKKTTTVATNGRTRTSTPPSYDNLPFIKPGKPKTFWHPVITDKYAHDVATGEHYAVLTLDYIRETGLRQLLRWIVRDMPKDGSSKGVQIGFLSKISQYSITGFGLCGHKDLEKADLYLVNQK